MKCTYEWNSWLNCVEFSNFLGRKNLRCIQSGLRTKIYCRPLICIIISVFCVCVWHSIGLAPRRDTNLRMVSLEPSGSEPAIFEKNFPKKWPVAKLRGKKFKTSMLFYGENIAHFSFLKSILSQNIKQFTTNINFEHFFKNRFIEFI